MQEAEWASYVDQAFSRMDLDGDGFIDLDELLSELPAAYFNEPGRCELCCVLCCAVRLEFVAALCSVGASEGG